jgi:hypothetical protein
MRSIKCALIVIAKVAEIKTTKAGQDYLSVTGVCGIEAYRCWLTAFSDIDDLLEKIRPDSDIYVEGTLKVKLDSQGDIFLHINAELAMVLFRPEVKLKEPARPQGARPVNSGDSLPIQPPAPKGKAKLHERPFDDDLPF